MLDLFNRGGWAMWPLLLAALICIAYIIERLITLTRARANPALFVDYIKQAFEQGGTEDAIALCNQNPSPVARIFTPALEKYEKYKGSSDMKTILEESITAAGSVELTFLDRGMLVIAAVAGVAPLMGFLGTVSGMIRAFDAIAAAGTIDPVLVSSGISEALITTATGLVIAIPAASAHVFFTSRINAYTRAMEQASNSLIEFLLEEEEKGG
ncbi:MAG: MotA/TolQ/ExbB proton channel family protein [Candidatus Cloacimonadota bacterium]|nr:MAG: MotA/TolQ/ExbB proton channel family protein [Candidatus Cloacimonadota bacterium]